MHDFSSPRGEFRSRRGRQRFDDDEATKAKRVRRRSLPPIEIFDATDGLPEGDRWSTWDQTEILVPNDVHRSGTHAVPRARFCLAACSGRYHGRSAAGSRTPAATPSRPPEPAACHDGHEAGIAAVTRSDRVRRPLRQVRTERRLCTAE